jgi:hypothetical protein
LSSFVAVARRDTVDTAFGAVMTAFGIATSADLGFTLVSTLEVVDLAPDLEPPLMHHSSILPTPHGLDNAGAGQRPSALKRAGLAIWRALEASGHGRALRELDALRGQWEISDPELAQQLAHGQRIPRLTDR